MLEGLQKAVNILRNYMENMLQENGTIDPETNAWEGPGYYEDQAETIQDCIDIIEVELNKHTKIPYSR